MIYKYVTWQAAKEGAGGLQGSAAGLPAGRSCLRPCMPSCPAQAAPSDGVPRSSSPPTSTHAGCATCCAAAPAPSQWCPPPSTPTWPPSAAACSAAAVSEQGLLGGLLRRGPGGAWCRASQQAMQATALSPAALLRRVAAGDSETGSVSSGGSGNIEFLPVNSNLHKARAACCVCVGAARSAGEGKAGRACCPPRLPPTHLPPPCWPRAGHVLRLRRCPASSPRHNTRQHNARLCFARAQSPVPEYPRTLSPASNKVACAQPWEALGSGHLPAPYARLPHARLQLPALQDVPLLLLCIIVVAPPA